MPIRLEWKLLDGVAHPNIIIAKCANAGRDGYSGAFNIYYNIYPSGKYVKEWRGKGDVVYIVDDELFDIYDGTAASYVATKNYREELFSKRILKSTVAAYFCTYGSGIVTHELFHQMIGLKLKSKVTLVDCQKNGEEGKDLAEKYGIKIVHCPCESDGIIFEKCKGTKDYFESLIRKSFKIIDSSGSLGGIVQ